MCRLHFGLVSSLIEGIWILTHLFSQLVLNASLLCSARAVFSVVVLQHGTHLQLQFWGLQQHSCPRHYFVRYTYRCSLKHQILTMTEDAGNRWRHKGTCVRRERLVYHSYDGFTVNGHANHRRDVLSKILCGQKEKGSRFTARCSEHKKKADLTLQRSCSLKTSLRSSVYSYVMYLQVTLRLSKDFKDFSVLQQFSPLSRCNLNSCQI